MHILDTGDQHIYRNNHAVWSGVYQSIRFLQELYTKKRNRGLPFAVECIYAVHI